MGAAQPKSCAAHATYSHNTAKRVGGMSWALHGLRAVQHTAQTRYDARGV